MTIKYVETTDERGWLKVKYNDGSTYPPLPQFLHVEFIKMENEREYFKILEGKPVGKEASVKIKGNGGSYLKEGEIKLTSGQIHYIISTSELWYRDDNDIWVGPINAITDSNNPVPIGIHDLEIPDEVHPLGERYLAESNYACNWFRISHSGDRYFHPGMISAGCVTVKDVSRWTDIYNYLIRRRKNDMQSVGTIQIFASASDRTI
ncbi:hypothetical protein CLPUN_25030 [Clostridium puniceum]|uniref:Uncharacterized protein n=1 Tax=Clostridium puniceum TaxID=29367 RepID=A0A1S8TGP4_9CLOT|nr:hypothetical protein [Clostridium puniceum]OOM76977.1 hypothetical protein CLPUN_25030 [Clostridium puniceum]